MKKEVMILMNSETLASIIESIIFVSGNAITIKDIAEKLEISEKQVLKEVEKLQKKYEAQEVLIKSLKAEIKKLKAK